MRSFLLVILFASLLWSCTNFITTVYTSEEYDSVDDEDYALIYYDRDQAPPETATFIGDIFVECRISDYNAATKEELEGSIFEETLYAGGNLVVLDYNRDLEWDSYLKGKVYYYKSPLKTDFTEEGLKSLWKKRVPDKVEGIYTYPLSYISDEFRGATVKYAIVKTDTNYLMVYLSGFEDKPVYWRINTLSSIWREGDIAAYIKTTDRDNFYEVKLVEYNKYIQTPTSAKLESNYFRAVSKRGYVLPYRKEFPVVAKPADIVSRITGFSIGDDRIVTSYHYLNDLDKGKEINIVGINDDFTTRHKALIECYDRDNDLAILKLVDKSADDAVKPFSYKLKPVSHGEKVILLGYPLSDVTGDDIKATNGIISSTTGYGGELNSYQISAPMHAGNNGSPLFDVNGNLIGMFNASGGRNETIGYSVKVSYLLDLLNRNGIKIKTQPEDTLKALTLPKKIAELRNSIFIIEITDNTPLIEEESYIFRWVGLWDYLEK